MGQNVNVTIDDFSQPSNRSHLYRYYCARGYIEPGDVVLDAACGYGYGTYLFSKIAKKAIGMDRDSEAVKYAMEHYKTENNYFLANNFDQLERFPECDVAITIETIEHLRYPGSFAMKLMMAARKRIFVTTPIVPTKHEDSTHLQDFNEGQIMEMFTNENWGNIDSSKQGPYIMASFYHK